MQGKPTSRPIGDADTLRHIQLAHAADIAGVEERLYWLTACPRMLWDEPEDAAALLEAMRVQLHRLVDVSVDAELAKLPPRQRPPLRVVRRSGG